MLRCRAVSGIPISGLVADMLENEEQDTGFKMADKLYENQEIKRKLERKKQALRDNLGRRKETVRAMKLDLDREMQPRSARLKPKDTQ